MKLIQRRETALAVVLSATAGYIDAAGFLYLSQHFVSFMSGNTTQIASYIANGHWHVVRFVVVLLVCFFAGTIVGAVAARFWDGRTSVLLTTSILVLTTAVASLTTDSRLPVMIGLPIAMGAVNATFLRDREPIIGLTYITGALVKAGHSLVDAFHGGPRWLWLKHVALWLALLIGGVAGAAAHRYLGMPGALWPPVVTLISLTVIVAVARRRAGIFGDDSV